MAITSPDPTNPATTGDLPASLVGAVDAQKRLDQAWRALKRDVPTLVARLASGDLEEPDVVDVICAAAARVLRNPEGYESGSGQLDDYSESWKRSDATLDMYFTAAELRRLSAPTFQNAGSFKYS